MLARLHPDNEVCFSMIDYASFCGWAKDRVQARYTEVASGSCIYAPPGLTRVRGPRL